LLVTRASTATLSLKVVPCETVFLAQEEKRKAKENKRANKKEALPNDF
jgi:hypothetical protein